MNTAENYQERCNICITLPVKPQMMCCDSKENRADFVMFQC